MVDCGCVKRESFFMIRMTFFALSTEKDPYFLFVGKAKLEIYIYIFMTRGDK